MRAFHKASVEVSVETSNAILSGPQPCEYIFHNICELGLYPNEISFVRNASGEKKHSLRHLPPSPFTFLPTKSPLPRKSLDNFLYIFI